MKDLLERIRLFWWSVTHILEITDYLSERIDRVEELVDVATRGSI